MSFRIKNVTRYRIPLLGIYIGPGSDADLLQSFSAATIRTALLFGELYEKIVGKLFALVSPGTEWQNIGLTEDEFTLLSASGIFQGRLGIETYQPPFKFDPTTGELLTKVSGISFSGDINVSPVAGDNPVVADRSNVILAGTNDGTKGGTVRFAIIDGYNNINVIDNSTLQVLQALNSKLPTQTNGSLPVLLDNTQLDGYTAAHIADAYDVSVGTYSYYIDMFGWRYLGLWLSLGPNTTASLWASGEFNVQKELANYTDVTTIIAQVAELEALNNHLVSFDTPFPFRWVKVVVDVSDPSNFHEIWVEKLKAY